MNEFNLSLLASEISNLHSYLQQRIFQQVNTSLTTRNWLVGLHIVEYEQNGSDRAIYGAGAIKELANLLKKRNIRGLDERSLRTCRAFYLEYPQIWGTVSAKLQLTDNEDITKWRTVSAILTSLVPKLNDKSSASVQSEISFPPEILLSRLSFSHFIELIKADSPLKRAFYEVQAIKNNWGLRELERAMNTLLFERTGLSANKEAVIAKIKDEMPALPEDVVKNPYFLEFLGLEEKPEYSETDLEEAIISHLQKFLVELGRGFCFEARQKRITFDNKHYKIDLVFYNRILKCHTLLDLKVGAFDHADAGQMNVYLNYYTKNEMTEGDNPPVGIILCANKNDALVEYATSGLPQEVFVSKYLVQLPSVEELKMLIINDRNKFKEA
ncbi:MAG TPA: cytoplasmic protein [Sphingobacteriaceae bacterium]|nr:cytoplasmic protein [Sphingobacteriaceae bacterium]